MNPELEAKLNLLRKDYEEVAGRPFASFFCPILLRDDPTSLCEAHVIPEAFPDSSRLTTIQRTDVDQFFGSMFEGEFTLLGHMEEKDSIDVLADRALTRRIRPQIFAGDRAVEYYSPKGEVPPHHARVSVWRDGRPPVPLVLKVPPGDEKSSPDQQWTIGMNKDVRLSALVSVLKAAHLTLFRTLGYKYALSASGHFLGWEVLGKFVNTNLGRRKADVLASAISHFRDFVGMVRPLVVWPPNLTGTVSDGLLYLCTGHPKPWAFLVFVRTGKRMHAVAVPVLEDAEGAARFHRFLRASSGRFEVRLARFVGDHWEVATDSRMIDWPEPKFD